MNSSYPTEGLRDYIKNGEFFADSRKWYNYKYLSHITHRIWTFYIIILLIITLAVLAININMLLPVKQKIGYAISSKIEDDLKSKSARIIDMDNLAVKPTSTRFIASSLITHYVITRESYDYNKLTEQLQKVNNTSSKVLFKNYYDNMNITNTNSPILVYQKQAKKIIEIQDVRFISDNQVLVTFNAIIKNNSGNVEKKIPSQSKLTFQIGDITKRMGTGSRFDFLVTEYQTQILEGKE